jgi:hypothetical protein
MAQPIGLGQRVIWCADEFSGMRPPLGWLLVTAVLLFAGAMILSAVVLA